MNYFNELLESYNKLKKRTFKLVYLNEQDNTVIATVIGILRKSATGPEWTPVPELGSGFNVRISKDGSIAVQDLSIQRQSNVVDAAGGQMIQNNTAQKIWDRMLAVFGRTEEVPEENMEGPSEGDLALQKATVIGGAFELFYGFEPKPSTLKNLKKVQENLDKYCKAYDSYMLKDQSLAKFCSNSQRYVTGDSSWGLEYKLARSSGYEFKGNEKELGIRVPLSPDLIDQAVESFTLLTDYLTNANKDDCDNILNRIGTRGKDLVLFDETQSEGILIPKYLESELVSRSIASLTKTCRPPTEIKASVNEYISFQEKNNVVGTMYEEVLQFNIRFAAFTRNQSLGLNVEAERVGLLKEFAAKLKANKAVLEQLSLEIDPEVAVDLRTDFINNEVLTNLSVYADMNTFKEWVQREMSFTQNLVNFMEADSAQPAGKETRSGGREDTLFVYADLAKAQAKAKIIGSTVQPLESGLFGVGVGQKRKKDLSSVKFGEVNTNERLQALLDESVTADDLSIEPGFILAANKMQFEDGYIESQERKDMIQYSKNLNHKITKGISTIENDKVYFDEKGKINVNSAESICKMIANQFKKDFSYKQVKDSIIGKFLFKQEKGMLKLKDFKDPDVRKRVAEAVGRVLRFTTLAKDIKKGSIAAQNTLVRMAIMCGANARDMGQVITADNGETMVFPHNEIFKKLAMENMNGDLKVMIPQGGATAYFHLSDGTVLMFSQEGTGFGEKRATRSLTQVSKDTITKLSVNLTVKDTNESIMLKFLEGQKLLLDSLFNQTKGN